jgi:hypothetical protein
MRVHASRNLGILVLGIVLVAGAVLVVTRSGTQVRHDGQMITPRNHATATVLADGRVLIVGGMDGNNNALAAAEIYDPKDGTFRSTGSMTVARIGHTATLLADGRVLVVGGKNGFMYGEPLISAELYDPGTGAFSPTGSMIVLQTSHSATLLAGGEVLIAGADDNGGPTSAELYDRRSSTFHQAIGPMVLPRYGHTATLLSDGRVLIVGGFSGIDPTATTEMYDPTTGRFSTAGALPADFGGENTATPLADGRVLLTATTGLARLFDPRTGAYSPAGSMVVGRLHCTATLLSDGRVLFAGGVVDTTLLSSAEVYDPKTGMFTATGSMASPRDLHTASLLADGTVLIAGGQNHVLVSQAEVYDPKTGTFRSAK